jgi:hypothetical protein
MHTVLWSTAAVLALTGVVLTSSPVLAKRPTCDQLLGARDAGQSDEDIAKGFGTTQARVEACARIEQQNERLSAARARFSARRAERGLPTP